ncbi:hypothetical protein BT96DRAFT_437280 [Gymnopus androsaceus JB14]|uniref:Uncharacterized protein n=1 Tax=Gymnopus androsaceus JB14 TaxID=1447944 RepID=A0A6A4GSS9_9AGAR|nr:hypothetical protein BT96DRAFT_437280 [Gymnopus androsaceus JB14]
MANYSMSSFRRSCKREHAVLGRFWHSVRLAGMMKPVERAGRRQLHQVLVFLTLVAASYVLVFCFQ